MESKENQVSSIDKSILLKSFPNGYRRTPDNQNIIMGLLNVEKVDTRSAISSLLVLIDFEQSIDYDVVANKVIDLNNLPENFEFSFED